MTEGSSDTMEEVAIRTDYIPLGQFLKLANCASTGGEAKIMLLQGNVRVNGEPERRRGRKLVPGDTVDAEGCGTYRVTRA